MGLITWGDNYSVGIAEVDEQHKKLVALVNDLHDAMSVGKGRQVLSTVLTELVEYTAYHFQTEERLFDQYGYPNRAEHKRLHEELTDKAIKLKEAYDQGNQLITIEVMSFLSNWLSVHILQEDMQYSAFLISKGVR